MCWNRDDLLAGPGLVETGYYSLPNKDCGRYWEFNCDYHLNCFWFLTSYERNVWMIRWDIVVQRDCLKVGRRYSFSCWNIRCSDIVWLFLCIVGCWNFWLRIVSHGTCFEICNETPSNMSHHFGELVSIFCVNILISWITQKEPSDCSDLWWYYDWPFFFIYRKSRCIVGYI